MAALETNAQPRATPAPTVRRMGYGPVRFTLADALNMVKQRIIPEDSTVELLDGSLVYRDRFELRDGEVVLGAKHSYVVTALGQLSGRINDEKRELRTQNMLVCTESHVPIPDGLIVRGTLDDYSHRFPTPADAYCVIEVADSSYERDTGEKLRGYAEAGIAQYIVINLRNRTAEIYTGPDSAAKTYLPPKILTASESLPLRVGEDEIFSVVLAELLP